MPPNSLSGKTALVTGASGLIGNAIATRLAAEGARVLLHYAEHAEPAAATAAEIEAKGGEAQTIGADLSSPDGPAALLRACDAGASGSRIDILVNNAGLFDADSILDASDDAFDRSFAVNVRAVFILAREAARQMSAAGWGRIVNIGSVFGEAVPSPGLGVYAASKFSVHGFTRAWSRDLGPLGITVNCVAPALVSANTSPPEDGPLREAFDRFISVGRPGKATDVAGAVAHLCRPESGYLTGITIRVDGGWSA